MCLKCTFLDRALVLEAVYECCVGKEDQVEIYNRFCDRLEQKHAPYLLVMDNGAYKLELPLLGEQLFVAEGEANTMNSEQSQRVQRQAFQIGASPGQAKTKVLSLRERAMLQRNPNQTDQPELSQAR